MGMGACRAAGWVGLRMCTSVVARDWACVHFFFCSLFVFRVIWRVPKSLLKDCSRKDAQLFFDVSRMATRVTAPSRTMKYICAAVLNLRKGGWDDSLTHLKHAYAAALDTNRTLHREALRYDNISRFTTCVSGRITSAGQMSWPTHFGHHH